MKKALSLFLTLCLLLSATAIFAMTVSAEDTEGVVYISDNGDDTNAGTSASAPIKTWSKAGTLLQATGKSAWRVIVVGKSTYDNPWAFMGISSMSAYKPTTVCGYTPACVFNLTRNEVAIKGNLFFENIVFLGDKAKLSLTAGSMDTTKYHVTFADTVSYNAVVYLSDAGDDANDGLSAATALKTLSAAVTALGGSTATGKIIVSGTFSYPNSWEFPAAKSLTFEGADENALMTFPAARQSAGIYAKSDLIFKNIKLQTLQAGYYAFYTRAKKIVFEDTVTCLPCDSTKPTDRTQYLALVLGEKSSALTANGSTYLYGGTFNNVEVGNGSGTLTGDTYLLVGKKCSVLQNLNFTSVHAGKVIVDIFGTVPNLASGDKTTQIFSEDVVINVYGQVNGVSTSANYKFNPASFASGKTLVLNLEHSAGTPAKVYTALADYTVIPYKADAPILAGLQSNVGTSDYAVRFAATIDKLDYKKIGFNVKVTAGTTADLGDVECHECYDGLNALKDGETAVVTAEELHGKYVYALAVKNIPTTVTAVTFTVTPYAVGTDDAKIVGNTYVITGTLSAGVFTATSAYVAG